MKAARNVLQIVFALVLSWSFSGASHGKDSPWLTDFAAAKAKATTEKKLLLVDFTGSDWCPWCKRLRAEVFDKEPFKAAAPKRFVLLEVDFPHEKKLPDKLKKQNEKLSAQYKVHGFPTVLLMNAKGEVLAQTGYRPGGAEKYVANLDKLLSLHKNVVKMRGELANAEGLSRAKLLDRLVDATTELGTAAQDSAAWTKEIIALDPENKAGLKGKYEARQLLADSTALARKGKFDEALKLVDKLLELPGLNEEQISRATIMKCKCLSSKKDYQGVIDCAKKGQKTAHGPAAAMLHQIIEHAEKKLNSDKKAKT